MTQFRIPSPARALRIVSPLLLVGLTACASGLSGPANQMVVLSPTQGGSQIPALCSVRNDRATWQVQAPIELAVTRSRQPLDIECRGADGQVGQVSAAASIRRNGNWLNRTSAMLYPEQIDIPMGGGQPQAQGDAPPASVQNSGRPPSAPLRGTRVGAVNERNQVPYIDIAGRDGYVRFARGKGPRAFAVSEAGHWARVNASPDAARLALERCQSYGAATCHLYAVDSDVVWSQPAR